MGSRSAAESRTRKEPSGLAKVAILAVDGLPLFRPRPFPREIGLAFGDGRTGMAWLVAPEAMWPQLGNPPQHQTFGSLGVGMHPLLIVLELLAAVRGLRIYAECHQATARWLESFFEAASTDMTFRLRDYRTLLLPRGETLDMLPRDELQQADHDAHRMFADAKGAACDAASHLYFAQRLSAIRSNRDRG